VRNERNKPWDTVRITFRGRATASVPFHSPFHRVPHANPYRDWLFHSSMISGGWVRKIQKNDLCAACGKGLSHVLPHRPGVRLDRSGQVRIRKRGRSRPEHPCRASWRVRGGGGSTENEGAVRRRKNTGFSPRFRRDFAGFILKQPAMNLSIVSKEKVRKNIQGRGEIPHPNRRANK